MSAAPAPPSKSPALWRRLQRAFSSNPEAFAVGLYALVAVAALTVAYFWIFVTFAPYDDEGTLLVTLKAFVNGDALYRDIWSVYGPFYYELFGGFFSLTGIDVTTDASRTIVIVIWVGSSLLFGLAAQRLTGRLALGITAMIAAFSTLNVLANEPMHPQVLCVLLLAGFALVAASGPTRRPLAGGLAGGALLAALVLTKVNLGIFAVAAVVVAAALTVEPLNRRAWLRWVLIAAFLAMPLTVLDRDLKYSWVRELLLLEALAATAVLVAAWPSRPGREGPGRDLTRWALGALAGFLAAAVAILVAIVLTGPSPHDVYEGMVRDALRIRDVLMAPFPLPPGAGLDWAIATLVAAVLATRLRLATADRPSVWPGLLRGLAGLAILLTVAHVTPLALNPSSASPVLIPMLLAWVAAIPPRGVEEPPFRRFLRLLVPMLAVAETLQVYPVPGSQLGIAAVSFVPVGALCLGDAVVELRAWSAARGSEAVANLRVCLATLAVALPATFALNVIVLPGFADAIQYSEQEKVALPGTELLRLPAPRTEEYEELVALLQRHHCTTFIGWPSVNSLYLWSGLQAPPPQIPNGWFYALSDEQQAQAVAGLRASPRPCEIKNEALAGPYLKGLPPPRTPLVEYAEENFGSPTKVGEFEFLLPKPSATDG